MKHSWMIFLLLTIGCEDTESTLIEKEKTTIRETYYLKTILHDDHLFILANNGYFIHHFDCPCDKNKKEEPEIKTSPSPIIIDFFNKVK